MKWNHTVYERSHHESVEDLQRFLNEMSNGSWELVVVQKGTGQGPGTLRYFFKRPWTITDAVETK